jgi:hypothetical protein
MNGGGSIDLLERTSMDIVIQCAATKDPNAGRFRSNGRDVHFVAAPELCSSTASALYARPDDISDLPSLTWRNRLEKYVDEERDANPLNLREAYRLYRHPAYSNLVRSFGPQQVFILSAGWGLVRADYLLPAYDVTFNRRAKEKNPAAFCSSTEGYKFFQQLSRKDEGPILFLGGRDYLPLFDSLTRSLQRERIVFTRAEEAGTTAKRQPRYSFEERPFLVAARTNWHYQCAQALAAGLISI